MAKGGSAEKVYAKEVYAPRAPAPALTVWKRARYWPRHGSAVAEPCSWSASACVTWDNKGAAEA